MERLSKDTSVSWFKIQKKKKKKHVYISFFTLTESYKITTFHTIPFHSVLPDKFWKKRGLN